MASIFNCRAFFLEIWKQQKAEAEAFGISLKSLLMDCLNQENLEKLKEAMLLTVYKGSILGI